MAKKYAKRWCYTLNNYDHVTQSEILNDDAEYHIYEPEVGENGTPHLQGFVAFKTRRLLSSVKKFLPTAHWEIARGSVLDNAKYCSKGGCAVVYGTAPREGAAVDWTMARRAAEEGRFEDIPDDMFIRYHSAFKRIRQDHPDKLSSNPSVAGLWIYGDSGVGKSRAVHEAFPDAYLKLCNKWWDGYSGEDIVIMDDVDPNHKVLGHHLKLWGDHYPFSAEVKGTTIRIRPKYIIVTSQYSISEVFDDHKTIQAVERRFRELKFTDVSAGMIVSLLKCIKDGLYVQ